MSKNNHHVTVVSEETMQWLKDIVAGKIPPPEMTPKAKALLKDALIRHKKNPLRKTLNKENRTQG